MNNEVTILVGGYLTVIGEYVKTLDDGRTCVRCNGQVFVGLRVK